MKLENVESLFSLLDSIGAGAILWRLEDSRDADSFVLECANAAASSQLGFAVGDRVGRRSAEILPSPALRESSARIAGIARNGGAMAVAGGECAEPNGGRAWFDTAVFGAGDLRVLVVFRNVSGRIQLERSLQQQAQMLDAVEQAIVATDLEQRIVYMNRFAEQLYGWAAAEAIGKRRHEVARAHDVGGERSQVLAGRNWSGDVVVRKKDGAPIPVHLVLAPITSGGAVTGVMGVSYDITSAKQSDERQRALLRAIPDLIFRFDRDGRILEFAGNREALARPPEEFLGKLIRETAREPNVSKLEGAIRRTLETRELVRVDVDVEIDRVVRSFEQVFVPVGESEVVAVARDVTGSREARIQLELLLADTERRVSERTHELRQMSRRLVNVQEDERRRLGRELHDEFGQILTGLKLRLAAVRSECRSDALDDAEELVRELLDKTRTLSFELRPPILDESGLVEALRWHVHQYAERTGIAVRFRHGEIERLDPEIETAAFRIVQEAMTNAARHARAAKIAVDAWIAGDRLLVEVEDDGVGFTASATVDAYSAGLRGMRERATLVDGVITIASRPGAGTRVAFDLPARRLERER